MQVADVDTRVCRTSPLRRGVRPVLISEGYISDDLFKITWWSPGFAMADIHGLKGTDVTTASIVSTPDIRMHFCRPALLRNYPPRIVHVFDSHIKALLLIRRCRKVDKI